MINGLDFIENLDDDQFEELGEENIFNFEPLISTSIVPPVSLPIRYTEKKNIKWQISPFSPPVLNLQPIENIQPIVLGNDVIDHPLVYFSKYFNDDDFELMVLYTNIYALQKGKPWKNTDLREMKIFISLHILMGSMGFPRIRMYWDSVLNYYGK